MLDCLKGLAFAMEQNWYSFNHFDLGEYEMLQKDEFGSMNWIIPDEILALKGPLPKKKKTAESLEMDEYVELFIKLGITQIVRLNKKEYEKNVNKKLPLFLYFPSFININFN